MDRKIPLKPRKSPLQKRSRQTVEDILDAATRILKRDGLKGLTTNKVALEAGLSIGSLYQYFPNKSSIFYGLHIRHVQNVRNTLIRVTEENRQKLRHVAREAVLEAFFEAQTRDGKLHEALENASYFSEKQAEDGKLSDFRTFLRVDELGSGPEWDLALKIAVNVIFSLAHELASRNLPPEDVRRWSRECAEMVSGYLEEKKETP